MLTITFTPTDEGQFYGSMTYEPADENVPVEMQQFYISLGHGLLTYATQETQEVCKVGIATLQKLVDEEQVKEAQNDTLDKAFDVVN